MAFQADPAAAPAAESAAEAAFEPATAQASTPARRALAPATAPAAGPRWDRPLHAELHYHVLGHLDLGRDDASLFARGSRARRAWTEALQEAYLAAPAWARLALQVLPLTTRNLSTLTWLLRGAGAGSSVEGEAGGASDRGGSSTSGVSIGGGGGGSSVDLGGGRGGGSSAATTGGEARAAAWPAALLGGLAVTTLDTASSRTLGQAMLVALENELAGVRQRWFEQEEAARARAQVALAWLGPWLARLRPAIYAKSRQGAASPPPLALFDCPALQHARGTHGRACLFRGELRLALNLAAPREEVLMQALHEELHQVTDLTAAAAGADASPALSTLRGGQDTAHGSPGHELHLSRERAAIAATERLLRAEAPELLPALARWQQRHRM